MTLNARGERIALGVLALTAGGLYFSGAFAEREAFAQGEAPTATGGLPQSQQLTAPHRDVIATQPFGEGLYADRGEWRGQASVGDLDQDGHLDIVASIRRWSPEETADGLHVWYGDGRGGFELGVEGIRRDMGYGGADIRDVDGDGLLDIAFSGHDTPPQVFLNNGDRTWTEASNGIISQGVCVDVALGDFDGDNAGDLAALGMFPNAGGLFYFQGTAQGSWRLRDELMSVEEYGNAITTTDIEGDGALELVAATSTGPRVWSHDGTTFVDRSEGLAPQGMEMSDEGRMSYIKGSDLDVLTHDFDGDGIEELLSFGMIYEGHPPVRAFKLDANGVWQPWGENLPADEAVFDAELAQLDGEGPEELVIAGRFGIQVLRVSPEGRFETLGRLAGSEGVVNLTRGDFDEDGVDEVVFIGFGGIRTLKPSL